MYTQIPILLKKHNQWVCWKYEVRNDRKTKVPKNPLTGNNAQTNKASTWGSFEQAVEAQKKYNLDGIGFCLDYSKIKLVGVDLDHCLQNGQMTEEANNIVTTLNSYTEITPSGEGLRTFILGSLPPKGRKKGNIELYTGGRFLTVTGNHLPETPTIIEDRATEIIAIHKDVFDVPKTKQCQSKIKTVSLTDTELLATAEKAKNGAKFERLYTGDFRGYSSQSEADLALSLILSFWTANDASRMDSLFRASGLYRDKWDEPHYADGTTYGQATINKAIENTVDFYTTKLNGTGKKQANLASKNTRIETYMDNKKGQTILNIPLYNKGAIVGYKSTPVADFVAKITQEITDEDGIRIFGIEGRTVKGRSFTLEINSEEFFNNNQLKAALGQQAGAIATIYSNMGKHLGASIQFFTDGDKLNHIKRYNRTGWANGKFLIPGREDKGVTINLPRKMVYNISPNADLKQGVEMLDNLLQAAPPEKSTILLSYIFTTSLAALANWHVSDKYGLFINGQTGTYKTTFMQCAMSIYGEKFIDDTSLIRFGQGATKNAMQKLATYSNDLPFLIDNYKPNVSPGETGFYSLIHSIVEGGEKDRLTRNSDFKESKPIHSWPIFTGEDVPDKDPASLARLLIINWTGGCSAKLTTVQGNIEHLSAVGGAWLTWLESASGKEAGRLAEKAFTACRTKWANRLRLQNKNTQNIMRIASNIAINELTWEAMAHPESPLKEIADRYQKQLLIGLEEVVCDMANATSESLEALQYLEALREIIKITTFVDSTEAEVGREVKFKELKDKHFNLIGWQGQDNSFYIKPLAVRKAVDDLLGKDRLGSVSNEKIYKQLESLEFIATKDTKSGKTTVVKRFGTQRGRVLHLLPNALDITD